MLKADGYTLEIRDDMMLDTSIMSHKIQYLYGIEYKEKFLFNFLYELFDILQTLRRILGQLLLMLEL